jgi:hypothetical protein
VGRLGEGEPTTFFMKKLKVWILVKNGRAISQRNNWNDVFIEAFKTKGGAEQVKGENERPVSAILTFQSGRHPTRRPPLLPRLANHS